MEDSEFYVAPLHEVSSEVLAAGAASPYLGPSQPGFRAPDSAVHVRFAFAGITGRGELRARSVRLAPAPPPCEWSPRWVVRKPKAEAGPPPGPPACDPAAGPPLRAAMRSSGLRSVRLIAKVAHEWQSFRTPEELCSAVHALEEQMHGALAKGNGEALCEAFLRAVGGLSPPGTPGAPPAAGLCAGLTAADAETWSRLEQGWAQLRSIQERKLRAVVICCMSSLDLQYGGVLARVLPGIRHLQVLLAQVDEGVDVAYEGRLQWRKIRSLTGSALQALTMRLDRRHGGDLIYALPRNPPRPAVACSVPGCAMPARGRPRPADLHGCAGIRCVRHSRGECNVSGCARVGWGNVHTEDKFGPPGQRCVKHGARQCNVEGCYVFACARVVVADKHGPPGRRCFCHGFANAKRCSVPGCTRQPHKRVEAADKSGPAGLRCTLHGGQACSVPGCGKLRWGRACKADEHGPPGARCWQHGGTRCSVPRCILQPVRKVEAGDGWGPPGARCLLHSRVKVTGWGPQKQEWPDGTRRRKLRRAYAAPGRS